MKKIIFCIGSLFGLYTVTTVIPLPVQALTINQETNTWQKVQTPKNFYTLEVTPWGLYGGEFTTVWNQYLYNGLYYSSDLGKTWQESGLLGKGINDIAFDDSGNLYATTYYWIGSDPPGLYKSSDKGKTWVHIGPDSSSGSVACCQNTLILGTYSHGVWTSFDQGSTWNQNEGVFWPSGEYLRINVSGNIVTLSNYYNSYISYDCGKTWKVFDKIPGFLSGFEAQKDLRLVCTATLTGMLRSTDGGKTFKPVENWGQNPCYSLAYYNGVYYAASHNNNTALYTVLKSTDKGQTWETINPAGQFLDYVRELKPLASSPGFIYAVSPGPGLFRYKVEPYTPNTQPFLDKLWNRDSMSQQTDAITAYFDHSYPLLAYPYKSEPKEESETTLNFWGDKEKAPKLYYSSHDGVDFGLKYGTPILAPASGYASYSYSKGGGHTIKIDHLNGYQTQYLHLQKDGRFVTEKDNKPKWIEKGEQIGLVGLTGTTTGPHLHFGVRYDKNQNGNFLDDNPDGRVDPYSWLDEQKEDPWEVYKWHDNLGDHNGSKSFYLWKEPLNSASAYIDKEGGSLSTENVSLSIPSDSTDKQFTLNIQKGSQYNMELIDKVTKYIQGTAVRITALDNLGNSITSFSKLVELVFDLSKSDLAEIIPSSIKVMYFNRQSQIWENVNSFWDETAKKVTAFTDHLSEFAVFGDKIDPNTPFTSLEIAGNLIEGWYTKYPKITLNASDGQDGSGVQKTFFSLDGGDSWEEYLTTTEIVKEGIYAILYRSSDMAENYESAKESPLIKVDTLGMFKDEVIINGAMFQIKTI